MNSTKTMICAALSALIALLTSCSCPQSVTLTLRDQPGEILQPLLINKDGNFVSEVDDPPEVICIKELEKKVKYLAEHYKITPGGWGPVIVYINAEDIPRNLYYSLNKWDKLCIKHQVPYILKIVRQNRDNPWDVVGVKSRPITARTHCVKEITIFPEKIQLRSPYGNNLHYDEFFRSAPELLLEIKKDRYMDKYSYRVILTNSNESIQWKFLHELAKFMNNHHLNYQVLWGITK